MLCARDLQQPQVLLLSVCTTAPVTLGCAQLYAGPGLSGICFFQFKATFLLHRAKHTWPFCRLLMLSARVSRAQGSTDRQLVAAAAPVS